MSSGAQSYIAIHPADPADPKALPPNTEPCRKVNFVSETLGGVPKTKKSKRVRSDRMLSGLSLVGLDVGGGIDDEFSFEPIDGDLLLAAALWGDWQELHNGSTTPVDLENGTVVHSTGILDLSGVATPPDNIQSGVTIRLKGTANTGANDGLYQLVTTGTAHQYQMTPHPPADETFAAGVTADGQWIKNGAVYHPLFIERGHVDVSQYFRFTGMALDTMAISIPDQDNITVKYGFVGLGTTITQAPYFDNYLPPSTNKVITSAKPAKNVRIDGVKIAECQVQQLTIDIKNNIKRKTGVGVFGACGTNAHQFDAGGKLTMQFDDEQQYLRLINGTEFSFGLDLFDTVGNGYTFDMPRCQLDTDKVNVTSVDNDVLDNGSFVAMADNATEAAIIICRFKA